MKSSETLQPQSVNLLFVLLTVFCICFLFFWPMHANTKTQPERDPFEYRD